MFPSPKFQFVLPYRQPSWVTGYSETSAPNDPKMTFDTTKSNVYIYE